MKTRTALDIATKALDLPSATRKRDAAQQALIAAYNRAAKGLDFQAFELVLTSLEYSVSDDHTWYAQVESAIERRFRTVNRF